MRIRKPSPAMVVAIIAVFVATAGSATAARLITSQNIKNGTITSADIRNGTVASGDIRDGGVTSGDIRNGSIKAGDLAPGAIRQSAASLNLPPGPPGPAGPAGPPGPQGPPGPSTLSGLGTTVGTGTIAADSLDGGVMPCPSGQRAVAGGYFVSSGYAFSDHPTPDRSGWQVLIDNTGSPVEGDLDIYVLCAGAGGAVQARSSQRLLPVTPSGQREIEARR